MTTAEGEGGVAGSMTEGVAERAPLVGQIPVADQLPDEQFLVSEAERSGTLASLVRAASSGQMTLEEFSRRTDIALVATTRAELSAVIGDIEQSTSAPAPLKRRSWVLFGHRVRRGRFVLPERISAIVLAGEIHIDLRGATMVGPEPTIKLYVLAGNLHLLVPRGIRVEVDQSSLFGGRTITDHGEASSPAAPMLRVRMIDMLGGVRVTNNPDEWGRGLMVRANPA